MSDLNLGPVELHNIKTSWSKTNKDQFYNKLYSNLLDQNRSLRQIFNNDDLIIKEHSNIFADLFNFVINNIDDNQLLDEFLYQFVNENQRFANLAVKYLESMGNALITTFKQVLNTYWTSVLELVWIKVYVFVANSILQYEEEVVSETNSMNEIEIPPLNIQRNLKSSPPSSIEENVTSSKQQQYNTPSTPKMDFDVRQGTMRTNDSLLNQFNSIEIDLKSNDKYKGFRRSMDVASSPIQVQIPTNEKFQKIHNNNNSNISSNLKSLLSSPIEEEELYSSPRPSFDPRKRKSTSKSSSISSTNSSIYEQKQLPTIPTTNDENGYEVEQDEFVTPKPSRRGSFSESYQATSLFTKLQSKQQEIDNSSEDSIEDAAPTFDPRRRRNNNSKQQQQKEIEVPSPESSEVDEQEEETYFISKQPQQDTVPERSLSRGGLTGGTFDYQSFGLKGLAPIVEDDDNSSKYESDGENKLIVKKSTTSSSSGEDSNSRTSSLSLHNSDYRSSISSGVDSNSLMMISKSGGGVPTPMNQINHQRNISTGSDDFQFSPPTIQQQQQPQQQQQQKKQHYNHERKNSMYSLSKSCSASAASINSNSRASLGFMRSSFILKKEIEQQGYNHPENVIAPISLPSTPRLNSKSSMGSFQQQQQPPSKSMYMNKSMSSASIRTSLRNNSVGGYNNVSNLPSANRSTQSFVSARETNDNISISSKSEKKGLRRILSSIFSSSKSNASTTSLSSTKKQTHQSKPNSQPSLQRISIPYEETSSSIAPSSYSLQNPYNLQQQKSSPLSPPPSISTRSKISQPQSQPQSQSPTSSAAPLFTSSTKPTVSSCATTNLTNQQLAQKQLKKSSSSLFANDINSTNVSGRYKYNGTSSSITGYSNYENGSIYSNESGATGFTSFLKKNKNGNNSNDIKFVPPPTRSTRKGNKYNVKKVPYNVFA
ncbi:uncharacterized protein KGF55_004874 [Candida pseudojiufengensis]|uniref:uncharacterized protein n=1 Tax=Candida pseudojiufengensis TaxID=497109 RepID=UPI002224C274|nr:uncharacterized protein KGF55_004874 [Candida pseudojiufengensis]KAI5960151.1 hypothetical protein KGF55_004874 [Candida pseudojiufengensis]